MSSFMSSMQWSFSLKVYRIVLAAFSFFLCQFWTCTYNYYYYYYKNVSSFSSDRQNLSPRLNLTSPFSYKGKNINVTSGETTFQWSTERFCSLLIEASVYKSVTITEEEEIRTVFERFGGTSQIVLVDENFLFFWGGGGAARRLEGVSR